MIETEPKRMSVLVTADVHILPRAIASVCYYFVIPWYEDYKRWDNLERHLRRIVCRRFYNQTKREVVRVELGKVLVI